MENGFDRYKKQKNRLRPWQGILLFVFIMISYYTVIAWMQIRFGMYGLAMTELYLLLFSVLSAVLCGADLKEIFPVRKPKLVKVFGTLLLWVSSYALVTALTMIVAYFFPGQMFAVGGSINELLGSVPLVISIFIASVMPAICEEAMHRGVILNSMKGLRREWLIVLVMGILFGLFHGSVWRFLPTAVFGGVLSYLMLKTENLVYPAIFHFTNNFFPVLLSMGQTETAAAESGAYLMEYGIPLATLGIYIGISCAAPFGLYTAAYLLQKEKGKKRPYFPKQKQTFRIAVLTITTVLPVIIGGLLFLYGIFFDDSLWRMIENMPVS